MLEVYGNSIPQLFDHWDSIEKYGTYDLADYTQLAAREAITPYVDRPEYAYEMLLRKGNSFYLYGEGNEGSDFAWSGEDGESWQHGECLFEIDREEALEVAEVWLRGERYDEYVDRILDEIEEDI